ncbi:MAG: fatty acid desaturase [Hyphomicrobiales bacterium]
MSRVYTDAVASNKISLSPSAVRDRVESNQLDITGSISGTGVATLELPTLALFASVYMFWALLVCFHELLPFWLVLPALTLMTTLHSSLQHEALHGHPTRSGRLNECIAAIPLGLFIPYRRFKRLHLRHHCDEKLTDPYDDPESFYLAQTDWAALSFGMRCLLRANNTLLGRLVVGPSLALYAFCRNELRDTSKASYGRKNLAKAWALHGFGISTVLVILALADFPVLLYICCVAYPAMSLLMLRTYAEHQAAQDVGPRTAIVDASPFFALLYLNNNLHFVHHRFPTAAWYRLPALYKEYYEDLNSQNGHYRIAGYWTLFRNHLVRAKEPVAHPLIQGERPDVVRSGSDAENSVTPPPLQMT